jgi:hypothetical protein
MPQHRLRIPDRNVRHAEERPMVWSDEDPREALQPGDVVTADGIPYIVAVSEMQQDRDGGLRAASYLVEEI